MYNILIICTGNICRSPMAEGILKKILPEALKNKVVISSAGTHALHGRQAEPEAIKAMDLSGIDISRHRARMINKKLIIRAHLILVMEKNQRKIIRSSFIFKRIKPRLLAEFGDHTDLVEIEDPYGQPLNAYLSCAEIMLPCLQGVLRTLRPAVFK